MLLKRYEAANVRAPARWMHILTGITNSVLHLSRQQGIELQNYSEISVIFKCYFRRLRRSNRDQVKLKFSDFECLRGKQYTTLRKLHLFYGVSYMIDTVCYQHDCPNPASVKVLKSLSLIIVIIWNHYPHVIKLLFVTCILINIVKTFIVPRRLPLNEAFHSQTLFLAASLLWNPGFLFLVHGASHRHERVSFALSCSPVSCLNPCLK